MNYMYTCTCMCICNPPTYKLTCISTCTRIYIYELHVYMKIHVPSILAMVYKLSVVLV